jgi:glutaminyl-peptide cyclotransferase
MAGLTSRIHHLRISLRPLVGGLSLLALLTACTPESDTPPRTRSAPPLDLGALDTSNAWNEVAQFVDLGPRDAGTPAARRAAEYLVQRLQTLGIPPTLDSFTDRTPAGTQTFHNVYATLPGTPSNTQRLIILMSHTDTKTGISKHFAGANDSASSTGLLLELARLAAQANPLPADLLFAFVDGEECTKNYSSHDGLHGSRRLLRVLQEAGQRPQAVILLDMIGDADLNVTIPANCDRALSRMLLQAAHATGTRHLFSTSRQGMIDDHQPFHEAGIPAIDIIDFNYGSTPQANDYWHTPEDTLDKLAPKSLEIVGRVLITMLNQLMQGDTP